MIQENARDFCFFAGYSPDGGKTQWLIAARSMDELEIAWQCQRGCNVALDKTLTMNVRYKSMERITIYDEP